MAAGKKSRIFTAQATDGPAAGEETYSNPVTILGYAKTIILLEEKNTNAIEYQIEVCPDIDESTRKWYVLLSWTDLAKDGEVSLAITDAWDAVRVGIRSNVEAADGSVDGWITRKRK